MKKNFYQALLLSSLLCGSSLVFAKQHNVDFPEQSTSYLKQVPRYEMQKIALLDVGLNKDQIRHILGNPHFKEGVFANQWNYVVDIKTENGSYKRCEVQFEFEKSIAQQMRWKDGICRQQYLSAIQPQSSQLKKLTEKMVEKQQMQASILFPLNKSDINSVFKLNPAFSQIIQSIRQSHDDVLVEGYTDTLGKPEYNKKLALDRATSIAIHLAENGVASERIKVRGHGQTVQFNDCKDQRMQMKSELKECLGANRRVNIIW